MSDDLELESGLGARTESRVLLAAREPAQIRRRDTFCRRRMLGLSGPESQSLRRLLYRTIAMTMIGKCCLTLKVSQTPKAYIVHLCFCLFRV